MGENIEIKLPNTIRYCHICVDAFKPPAADGVYNENILKPLKDPNIISLLIKNTNMKLSKLQTKTFLICNACRHSCLSTMEYFERINQVAELYEIEKEKKYQWAKRTSLQILTPEPEESAVIISSAKLTPKTTSQACSNEAINTNWQTTAAVDSAAALTLEQPMAHAVPTTPSLHGARQSASGDEQVAAAKNAATTTTQISPIVVNFRDMEAFLSTNLKKQIKSNMQRRQTINRSANECSPKAQPHRRGSLSNCNEDAFQRWQQLNTPTRVPERIRRTTITLENSQNSTQQLHLKRTPSTTKSRDKVMPLRTRRQTVDALETFNKRLRSNRIILNRNHTEQFMRSKFKVLAGARNTSAERRSSTADDIVSSTQSNNCETGVSPLVSSAVAAADTVNECFQSVNCKNPVTASTSALEQPLTSDNAQQTNINNFIPKPMVLLKSEVTAPTEDSNRDNWIVYSYLTAFGIDPEKFYNDLNNRNYSANPTSEQQAKLTSQDLTENTVLNENSSSACATSPMVESITTLNTVALKKEKALPPFPLPMKDSPSMTTEFRKENQQQRDGNNENCVNSTIVAKPKRNIPLRRQSLIRTRSKRLHSILKSKYMYCCYCHKGYKRRQSLVTHYRVKHPPSRFMESPTTKHKSMPMVIIPSSQMNGIDK